MKRSDDIEQNYLCKTTKNSSGKNQAGTGGIFMQDTRSSPPILSLSRISRVFSQSVSEVFADSLGLEVVLKEVFVDEAPAESLEVTVIIGLTGDIEGNVFYTFSPGAARVMLEYSGLGYSGEVVDDGLKSSLLCEISNMISGLATVGFEKYKKGCRLTPPAIIQGSAVRMSTLNSGRIVVLFEVKSHPFVLHIAIKG
jgi:chemotaxis protein CheX